MIIERVLPYFIHHTFEDKTEQKIDSGTIKNFMQQSIFYICPHMAEDNKNLTQGKKLMAYHVDDY